MFLLSSDTIDAEKLKQSVANPESGACVIFEGWVRNHNEGMKVNSLEYEGYPELCQSEAEQIFKEAVEKFQIESWACVHRVGHLAISDMAVWLGVTARHRGAAFEACKFMIDQIKARLPIWKKEHYEDGHTEWVNCQECAHHGHSHSESIVEFEEKEVFNAYYKRQMVLKGWGEQTQHDLAKKRILVVGAGGLGCGALPYLAGAGVGRISICDPDVVDISNLQRQPLFNYENIGHSKAELAADALRKLNPLIHVKAWDEAFEKENADRLLQDCDLVLDCTDNFKTKYLLNDACWQKGIPLIFAGIYRWEGQLMVFHPERGRQQGCLRCLWPEIPDQNDMGTCAQVGILGSVAGSLGSLQAIEATKVLLGFQPDSFFSIFDYRHNDIQKLERIRNPSCPLCGDQPRLKDFRSTSYQAEEKHFEWEVQTCDSKKYQLVDIREAFEIDAPLEDGVLHLPFSRIQSDPEVLDRQINYLFACPKGIKSRMLVLFLRERGFNNAFSLYRGFENPSYARGE